MLGLVARGADPRHRGQPVVARVVLERPVRLRAYAPLVQVGAGLRVLERGELLQHVGAVVVLLLVHLPADAGVLEALRVRRPTVGRRRDVADDRAALCAAGVDRTGHPHQPVGPGGTEHRAEVVVADGEGLGERELERDVLARVIAHHIGAVDAVGGAVGRQPLVHLAVVPGLVLHRPGVTGGRDGLRAGGVGVEVERKEVALRVHRVRLVEDAAPGVEFACVRVGETANAGQRAEVVVERPVLLHQHDDVFDVAQRAVLRRLGGDGFLDARREEGECRGAAHRARGGTQESATCQLGHDCPFLKSFEGSRGPDLGSLSAPSGGGCQGRAVNLRPTCGKGLAKP